MTMRVLVLGGNGIAGHMISIYLSDIGYDVDCFTRTPVKYCKNILGDILDFNTLKKTVLEDSYDVVIDAIGILTHEAEAHKSEAILLNSFLPHFLSEITHDIPTRVINLATNCVFSGSKGYYQENDIRDGLSFYDRSKGLGELQNNKDLTFRTSFVGPDLDIDGIGLFNWFMKQTGTIKGYDSSIWSGVTTLELAKAIDEGIKQNLNGLYHLVNNEKITKYNLIDLFKDTFSKEDVEIESFSGKFEDKSLQNTRSDFQYQVPSYEDMIKELEIWMKAHKELYPHYFKG